MRLLDRITERWSTRQQGYFEGMASGAAVLMTYGTDSKREIAAQNLIAAAQQQYETSGVVFGCVLNRMMLLSEATFKFRTKANKEMYGTEDLRLLEYPWPNGQTSDLIMQMELDASMAGNCFLWKVSDDLIVRLPPREVTIVSEVITDPVTGARYKQPCGYDWDPTLITPGPGLLTPVPEAHTFTVDEIVHYAPLKDPYAYWRGMSWVQPIMRESYADSAMVNYKTLYMDHGHPVSVVKYHARLLPATVDAIVERIQAKYGGVSNAWRPLVLDQGADPVMGAPMSELDFRNIQAGGEERICAAAGVPPIIVGLRNAESGETYQTAMRRFADLTCRPLWRSICSSLEKIVPNMPPKGVQLWYDTTDIAALQAAETERAQVTQVSAAALLTFVQAGFTRASSILASVSGDLSLLVPDPNAPTPGVAERETITATLGAPITGPDATATARPAVAGVPPGGGQTLTKPQTAASKKPGPSSYPTPATTGAPSSNGSSNG